VVAAVKVGFLRPQSGTLPSEFHLNDDRAPVAH